MTIDAALAFHIPPPQFPFTVTALQNPVTRFDVKVEPAIEVTSELEWAAVAAKFTAYCRAAWAEGPDMEGCGPVRLSPGSISADWLKWTPAAAPTEPE